jgi:hypothetical protein
MSGAGAQDAGPGEGAADPAAGRPDVSARVGGPDAVEGPDSTEPSERLTGGEAIRAHLTLFVGLALCAVAFWFEVRRALGGNGLSWAYVFEWPLFAVFAVYMWWNVLRGGRPVRRRPARPGPALDPRYAGMLAAWESHQRELQAARTATESVPRPGPGAGEGPVGKARGDDARG